MLHWIKAWDGVVSRRRRPSPPGGISSSSSSRRSTAAGVAGAGTTAAAGAAGAGKPAPVLTTHVLPDEDGRPVHKVLVAHGWTRHR